MRRRTLQTCRTCGESKPVSAYYKTHSKRGTCIDCKECFKDRQNRKRWDEQLGTQSPPPKRCKDCGEPLPNRRGERCTTGECYAERERKRQRDKYKRRREAQLLEKPLPECRNCGKTVSRYGINYCGSKECAQASRDQWFIDHPEERREYNRKNKAKRRSYLRQADTDDVTWAGVMERDNWECQLCGEKIDKNAKAPSPESASWDHIIPLSHGGRHTWDNLQAAHYGCNSRKGNRVALNEESLAA